MPSARGDTLAFASCEAEASNFSNLFIEKTVSFGKALLKRGSIITTVHLRGREKSKHVPSLQEAQLLIREIASAALCCGCGMKPVSGKYFTYRKMNFAGRCLLSTGAEGKYCAHFEYL